MPTQDEKYAVAMAGEHFVAAELLRRGVAASVTMGNAKRADVIVMNRVGTKVVVVEVKSSPREEWIVGSDPPSASNQPWVFVHIPAGGSHPRYFIFTARELQEALLPRHDAYLATFQARHGKPFTGKGVMKFSLAAAVAGEGRWDKILQQIQ